MKQFIKDIQHCRTFYALGYPMTFESLKEDVCYILGIKKGY